ncbi:MAG: DUF3298 and DUF4163 domain-containing protein [Sediminicola sp.]|tara:strand:- start:41640 stop:42386 length:747 start_codon:yes stop_codon:yes gene_type:complete
MKTWLPVLTLVFFALQGCKKDDRITFEPIAYKSDPCAACPKVEINIPNALEETPISQTINNSLKEEIIFLLTFEEGVDVTSIEEALSSFKRAYLDQKNTFLDESIGWEAKIDGEVTHEDKNILTIQVKAYVFTGGAHGYSPTRFLNFNKVKGLEMDNLDLFKDQEAFLRFAEARFRQQEGVPQDTDINSTGFMFEDNIFHLPENMGFTQTGLQLFYDQYEIASYADGPIVVDIPMVEVKPFLDPAIIP